MNLKNKSIFITGVGKGIGFAILKKVIAEGGYVYALTRSKKDLNKFKNNNVRLFFGNVNDIKLIKVELFIFKVILNLFCEGFI